MVQKRISLVAIFTVGFMTVWGQTDTRDWLLQLNTITTAVPFLNINPETRGGGMGDVGVATSPDGASQHWNAAKICVYSR